MENIEEIINNSNLGITKSKIPESTDPISKLIEKANTSTQDLGGNTIDYNPGVGESRFDEGFNSSIYKDLEDYRSKQQHWSNKVGKGALRIANKVGVEIAKMPGYIGGAIAAIGAEEGKGMDTFVNNAWIKAIDGYEEYVNNEVLPVYVKESIRNGDVWANALSLDFWATEGADGIGFLASMFVPGVAISKLGVGMKLLKTLGKVKYGDDILRGMEKGAQALGYEARAGKISGKGTSAAGSMIDVTAATITNTMLEAGAEANGIMKSITKRDNESEQAFELRKAEAARNVFVGNLAVLLLPNAILNRNLLGNLKPKAANNFIREGGRMTNAIQSQSFTKKASKYLNTIGSNIAREGFFEEGTQTTLENYFKENDSFDSTKMFNEYFNTLNTVEGQKAILLGSVFGSVSGTIQNVIENKRTTSQINKLSNAMNQGIDLYEKSLNGIYKKDNNGALILDENGKPEVDYGTLKDIADAQTIIQKRNTIIEQARAEGDTQTVNFLENQLQNELAMTFIKAGEEGITLLKEQLEGYQEQLPEEERNLPEVTKKIDNIISNARMLMKEHSLFNSYGVKINPKNKELLPEFASKLENLYIKNRGDLKYINDEIKNVNATIAEAKNTFMEELDLTEKDLKGHPIFNNLNKTLQGLEASKQELKEEYLKLISEKSQKEMFSELEKNRELIDDIEALNKENIEKAEKEQKTEVKNNLAEEEVSNDEQNEEALKNAKNKVNDLYGTITNIFDDSVASEKKGEGIVEGTLPGSDKVEKLRKGGTGKLDDDGKMSFMGGVPKELSDLFPETQFGLMTTVQKIKDDEGNDSYLIKTDGQTLPIISKYELVSDNEVIANKTNDLIDENISNLDQAYDIEQNKITARESEAAHVQINTGEKADQYGKKNKPIVERKHVKLVDSPDTNFTSENYKEFRETPRDKTNETVTFELGNSGTNQISQEASAIYNRMVYDGVMPSKEEIVKLIEYLPIRVKFGGDIYTQLFNELDNKTGDTLSKKDYEIRKAIVETIIANKSFDGISSQIKFQFPGWIQNDESNNGPAQNSVLELDQINNNIDNIELLYSNKDGRLFTPLKEFDKDFGDYVVNSINKGSIFLKVKAANGRFIPLKLNVRRINELESELILNITEKLLNPEIEIKYQDRINQYPDLEQWLNQNYSEEIKGLGLSIKDSTISELFSNIMYEGTSVKNKFKVTGEYLKMGPETIKFEDFNNKKDDIKAWLLANKNRNIKVSKLNEQSYVRHMLESKTISTDVKLGEPIFQGVTDIYINPIIKKDKPFVKSINTTQSEIEAKNLELINRRKKDINKLKNSSNLLAYHYLTQKIGIQNPYGSDTSLITNELGLSFKEAENLVKQRQSEIKPQGWKLGDNYDTSNLDLQVNDILKNNSQNIRNSQKEVVPSEIKKPTLGRKAKNTKGNKNAFNKINNLNKGEDSNTIC